MATKELFPRNNIRRSKSRSFLDLRLDVSTIDQECPVLFGDGDFLETEAPSSSEVCHSRSVLPIAWKPPAHVREAEVLQARLFSSFGDVVCIFADDYGGLSSVGHLIRRWASSVTSAEDPQSRTRILVVVSGMSSSVAFETLEVDEFRKQLVRDDGSLLTDDTFRIKIVKLADDSISALARYRRLKEILLNELDSVREVRLRTFRQFSALHLQFLFSQALKQFTESYDDAFNFIRASRTGHPVSSSLCQHLSRFVKLSKLAGYSLHSISKFISSALLLDANPPKMHGFDPSEVYETLYETICLDAFSSSYSESNYVFDLNDRIKHDFIDFSRKILDGSSQSSYVRRQYLSDSRYLWRSIQSNRTCLLCLCRAPEHVLTCGHSTCDACLKIFGMETSTYEYHFKISSCLLCVDRGSVLAKVLPPTAGVRILTIDGGGICGVIPLEFLQLLQRILGPTIAIQDLFDVVFGTSSGGLTALGLFLRNWDIKTCAQKFTDLGLQLFGSRKGRRSWRIVSRLLDILHCLLSDGCYDIDLLNSLLQGCFGKTQAMFGGAQNPVSGTKVALTATTISDASPCIFPNYNGQRRRPKECGYRVIRADEIEEEPLVWEVGRATSAAPVLFTPIDIPFVGSFQDGGLRHNNPVNLALTETKRIWSEDVHLDIVLSLGTGREDQPGSPTIPVFRNVFKDGFLSRLTRSLVYSLNGEGPWRECINRLDTDRKESFIRMNIPLPRGVSVRLDDITKMAPLKAIVLQSQSVLREEQDHTILSLLLSTFFLELDRMPVYYEGMYYCAGSLKCRYDARKIFQCLRTFSTAMEIVTTEAFLGTLQEESICNACHRFKKTLILRVRDLARAIPIYIKTAPSSKRLISGSPQSMLWYVKQQQLESAFGTADHGTPGRVRCLVCVKDTSERLMPLMRKRKADDRETQYKKPRL